ncbi:MAG: DUF3429 domain-containing protein [Pseudomonadota bacterium]
MTFVPLPALALSIAGLLPFVAGALAARGLMPGIDNPVTGVLILQTYGAAILAFMGGCLWGFAVQADRATWRELGAAVLPGLWAFSVSFSPDPILSLMIGFVFVLALDLVFRGWGLNPEWWPRLRLPLTAAVLACLAIGKIA